MKTQKLKLSPKSEQIIFRVIP